MSIFGHSIEGGWQERGLTIVVDTKGYNLNILDQLMIRLANYEQPVTLIAVPHRKQFTKTDIKAGGMFTRDTDVRERILQYAVNYPTIRVKIVDRFELSEISSLHNQTVIFLNTQGTEDYIDFLRGAGEGYTTNKDDILRIFFVKMGVFEGKSRVSYRLNWDRGYLTGGDEREYNNPRTIKQTQELKILTSLLLNDILTGRRMTYESLTLDKGEIIKDSLQLPELTPLQLSGIIGVQDELNDLLNSLLTVVGEDQQYITDRDSLVELVRSLVTSYLTVIDSEQTIYDVLIELNNKVETIDQVDLLARWSDVLLELYKTEITGRLFAS